MRDVQAQAMFGGPWGTVPVNLFPLDPTAGWIRVTPAALVCLGLVMALLFRRRAWMPVLMATSYAVMALALTLFSTSYSNFGAPAMVDTRFHADCISIWWLAIAMISTPNRAELLDDDRILRRPMGSVVSPRFVTVGWVAALAIVVLGATMANGLLFGQTRNPPGRAWAENVRADVDRLGPALILEGRPPIEVFPWGFWPEEGWLSLMLSPLSGAQFEGMAKQIYTVSPRGRLVPGEIGSAAQTLQGGVSGCGYAVGEGRRSTLTMDRTLGSWPWGYQLDVFAGQSATLRLWIDGHESSVHVPRGVSRFKGVHNGTVTTLRAQTDQGSGAICLVGLRFGAVSEETP